MDLDRHALMSLTIKENCCEAAPLNQPTHQLSQAGITAHALVCRGNNSDANTNTTNNRGESPGSRARQGEVRNPPRTSRRPWAAVCLSQHQLSHL